MKNIIHLHIKCTFFAEIVKSETLRSGNPGTKYCCSSDNLNENKETCVLDGKMGGDNLIE